MRLYHYDSIKKKMIPIRKTITNFHIWYHIYGVDKTVDIIFDKFGPSMWITTVNIDSLLDYFKCCEQCLFQPACVRRAENLIRLPYGKSAEKQVFDIKWCEKIVDCIFKVK